MKRKTSYLSSDNFEKFIVNSVKYGLEEVGLYSTGEPFMSKNLVQYIKISKNFGIKRVYVTTNGALATLEKVSEYIEAGLDSIKFSINASSIDKYKIVHGYNDFEKVIKNIQNIYDYKKKIT